MKIDETSWIYSILKLNLCDINEYEASLIF